MKINRDQDAAIVGRRAGAQRVCLWRRVGCRKEKGSRQAAAGLQHLKAEADCTAREDCTWVAAVMDKKSGKEKRRAYCRAKPKARQEEDLTASRASSLAHAGAAEPCRRGRMRRRSQALLLALSSSNRSTTLGWMTRACSVSSTSCASRLSPATSAASIRRSTASASSTPLTPANGLLPDHAIGDDLGRRPVGLRRRVVAVRLILEQRAGGELHRFRHHLRMQVDARAAPGRAGADRSSGRTCP